MGLSFVAVVAFFPCVWYCLPTVYVTFNCLMYLYIALRILFDIDYQTVNILFNCCNLFIHFLFLLCLQTFYREL